MLQLHDDACLVTIEQTDMISDSETVDRKTANQRKIHKPDSDSEYAYNSVCKVRCDADDRTAHCLILAHGGHTGVHPHSAFLHNGHCVIAVGQDMLSLQLPTLALRWRLEADVVTCFGVYHVPQYACYISHGELAITCVSYDGHITWQSGGRDIFTGDFTIHGYFIEAIDFYDDKYHIDLATGDTKLIT